LTVAASVFTIFHEIVMLSFSVMVLIVFYAIPDRFKLIAPITAKTIDGKLDTMDFDNPLSLEDMTTLDEVDNQSVRKRAETGREHMAFKNDWTSVLPN